MAKPVPLTSDKPVVGRLLTVCTFALLAVAEPLRLKVSEPTPVVTVKVTAELLAANVALPS